ncbi:MAG: hypothetical protein ACRCW2_14175 [Cellulosilyticaceae bacterium]
MINYLFILVGELFDLLLDKCIGKTVSDLLEYRMVTKPRIYWLELDLSHETLKFIGEAPFENPETDQEIGNEVSYRIDSAGNHQYYTNDQSCYRMVTTPTLVDYEVIAVAFMQKPYSLFVEEHIQVGMYTFLTKHLKNYSEIVEDDHGTDVNYELYHARLALVNKTIFEMQSLLSDYEPISED